MHPYSPHLGSFVLLTKQLLDFALGLPLDPLVDADLGVFRFEQIKLDLVDIAEVVTELPVQRLQSVGTRPDGAAEQKRRVQSLKRGNHC